jgi:probable HAF family extracellular repeat protein
VPGAAQSSAAAINAHGEIVGFYFGSNGGPHSGFLYSGGVYTTIDFPGSYSTDLTGINARGEIVGYFTDASGGLPHGFIYNHGTYTRLDFPGAVDTEPTSINASGEVVGFYQNGVAGLGITSDHGFAYNRGEYTTIDAPGSIVSTDLTPPSSINNRGQIVGYYSAGTEHGFIASPQVHDNLASEVNALSGLKGADAFVFPSTLGESQSSHPDTLHHPDTLNHEEVQLAHSLLADLTAIVAENNPSGVNAAHDPDHITTSDHSALHNLHANHFLL